MKSKIYTIPIHFRRPKTREELKRERRWRIAENIVNVLLGIAIAVSMFYSGWLVGSGAFVFGG